MDILCSMLHDLVAGSPSGPDHILHQSRNETIRARAVEGTAGFLLKPFGSAALLAAIKSALQAS
jgi:DNA-binding NarL/FixJ family response regulator